MGDFILYKQDQEVRSVQKKEPLLLILHNTCAFQIV